MSARFTLALLVAGLLCLGACGDTAVETEEVVANQADIAAPAAASAAYPYAELADEFAAMEAKYPKADFYPAGYYQAKLAAGLEAKEERPMDARGGEGPDPIIDLFTCSSAGIYAYTLGDHPDGAAYDELAKVTVELERMFTASGFTPAIVAEPFRNFERRMIQAVDSWPRLPLASDGTETEDGMERGQEERLAFEALREQLESNRMRLAPNLPRVTYEGGCGAGEAPVTIRSDPPRATVWLIRAFDFYKCGLRKSNPWDPNACPWLEVSAGEDTELSGRYFYRAVWPDGRSKRGNHAFTYSEEFTDEPTDVFTVKL